MTHSKKTETVDVQSSTDTLAADLIESLSDAGFDCGVAVATEAELQAGAACGQLSSINEL